jgi:hypothetical protein
VHRMLSFRFSRPCRDRCQCQCRDLRNARSFDAVAVWPRSNRGRF